MNRKELGKEKALEPQIYTDETQICRKKVLHLCQPVFIRGFLIPDFLVS